jgi:hypothetical protein
MTPVIVRCDNGEREIRVMEVVVADDAYALVEGNYWKEIGVVDKRIVVKQGLQQTLWTAWSLTEPISAEGKSKQGAIKNLLLQLFFRPIDENLTIPGLF